MKEQPVYNTIFNKTLSHAFRLHPVGGKMNVNEDFLSFTC